MIKSVPPGIFHNYSYSGKGMAMTFKPAFVVAVLSAWIGIAGADGIKPPPTSFCSTWRMVRISPDIAPYHSSASTGEELRKKNECTSDVTQPSANTYVEESRCAKGPNAGSVTKVIYTYQGDTASHTEMHMNVGNAETVMIIDAKYLGSCPAGMKPGDLIIDGKVISGGG